MNYIDLNNSNYPKKLKEIKDNPNGIYIEGNESILNSKCIGIIGSRSCTSYGEKWCRFFVEEFVKHGITIVSGMAVGIDTIAHKTAIESGGKTIAVLPSGLNNIYPVENKELYDKILMSKGAVITEYDKNVKANSKKFLERNRIISGISIGVLIVEAGYRSGTSVTAKFAKHQKRDVFCIPGSLDNPKSYGTNELIKKYAELVTSPYDIVKKYGFKIEKNNINKKNKILNKNLDVPKEYKNVLRVINNEPQDINEIAYKTGLNLKEVIPRLLMLEIKEKIKKVSGNRYILY